MTTRATGRRTPGTFHILDLKILKFLSEVCHLFLAVQVIKIHILMHNESELVYSC